MGNDQRRIGIFIYRYPVAYSTGVMYSAQMLAEAGYQVDIFVDRFVFEEIEQVHPQITVTYCTRLAPLRKVSVSSESPKPHESEWFSLPPSPSSSFRSLIRRLVPDPMRNRLWQWYYGSCGLWISTKRWLLDWLFPVVWFLFGAARHVRLHRYCYFVGIEPEGLAVASVLAGINRTPYYYHSLELFQVTSQSPRTEKIRKWLEKAANRRAAFSIAQDQQRAECLAIANSIPIESVRLVPVAELGPATTDRSNALHQRLQIAANKCIILNVGAISKLNMGVEIARQTLRPDWPEGFVVVFHGFAGDKDYLAEINRFVSSGRVYLSLQSVSFRELSELTASATIGIALYEPVDDNFQLTVFSSGKIAQYLKCGLPIIVNDFPATRAMISEYGCGTCISTTDDLVPSILELLKDYSRYQAGSIRAFQSCYTFQEHYSQILQALEAQCSHN